MHFLAATAPRFLERDLRTVWQYRLEREGLQRILRLQTPLYSYASSYSAIHHRRIQPTYPSLGCKNASGNCPTISKPQLCHDRTAFSFVATTKLNCFARNERALARSIVWSHIIRASPSCLCRRRHLAAIGHVGPAALLIRLQKLCAENFSMLFRDKHFMVGSHPIGQRFVFAHFPWQRVGLSCPHHWL
jgi:hypothetical protein